MAVKSETVPHMGIAYEIIRIWDGESRDDLARATEACRESMRVRLLEGLGTWKRLDCGSRRGSPTQTAH